MSLKVKTLTDNKDFNQFRNIILIILLLIKNYYKNKIQANLTMKTKIILSLKFDFNNPI